MIPASGAIIFDSQSPNSSIISPLSAAPRLSYDNAGGLNISSYTTGESFLDRFTVDGSYGRLFGVSDSVTGVVFSVNDAAGLPIVEVESNFTDKITMGTYGSNALVVNDNKIGIGNPAPTAKLDIAETWNSNITVTGASGTGSVATITFAAQSAAIVVGSTIVVASINPSGYNGTFVVTASTTTSVSYANATTAAWVSGGTIQQLFTSVKLNVTDTASNAGSNLMDLQVGGVSKFGVNKAGVAKINNGGTLAWTSADSLFISSTSGYQRVQAYSYLTQQVTACIGDYVSGPAQTAIAVGSSSLIGWSSGVNLGSALDTMLVRDGAAGTLAQRNLANAQTFRLYNSTDATPATNFDRATFGWTSNVLRIGTEMGGSYTTARGVDFITNGAVRMSIAATGLVKVIGTFNTLTLDIGATGENCGFGAFSNNAIAVWANGAIGALIGRAGGYSGLRIGSDGMYRFSDTTVPSSGVSAALALNAAGIVEVNNGTAGTFRDLRVRSVIQQPPATITPASNGDLVFEATSNTSLTLRLKGTDGVVRSASLTLA